MAQYFFGDDTYGARLAIAGQASEQGATIQHLYESDVTDESLGTLFDQGTTLFGASLLIVHNPSELPKAVQEKLMTAIKERSLSHLILWDQTSPDKRSRFWKQVKSMAREFPTLSAPDLSAWLSTEAKEREGSITDEAVQELIERTSTDRWRLASELERLLLLHGAITKEHVVSSVAAREEAEIFSTLDALVSGNAPQALGSIEKLLAAGESELYILAMLAYQFRTLLIIRLGIDESLTAEQIAQRGKLHPYSVQKNWPVATRTSRGALLASVTKIAATDFAIKQGKADARTALMMLVLSLARA